MATFGDEQRRQLGEDGVCVVPQVLSLAELDRVNATLARGVALAEQRAGTAHDP